MKFVYSFICFLLFTLMFAQVDSSNRELGKIFHEIRNNKVGCVNEFGKIIIPFLYEIEANDMILNNYAQIETVIDEDNSQYEVVGIVKDTSTYYQNVIPLKLNGFYGYVNFQNETVIPFEYEEAGKFRTNENSSFAIVKRNGKYGVISSNNKVLIDFTYDEIYFVPNYSYYFYENEKEFEGYDAFYVKKEDFYFIINLKKQKICLVFNEKHKVLGHYLCN